MNPEPAKLIGLDICPHCGGTDLNLLQPFPLENCAIGQRCECENCGKGWAVEYRPHSYTTDGRTELIVGQVAGNNSIIDDVLDGLQDYYSDLKDPSVREYLRENTVIPDTGNRHEDYLTVRDKVEKWVDGYIQATSLNNDDSEGDDDS